MWEPVGGWGCEGLSGLSMDPALCPLHPKPLHTSTALVSVCPGGRQPHLGLLHTLHGLSMFLGAGAEHLHRADRCEGPGTAEAGLTIVLGASRGWGSTHR